MYNYFLKIQRNLINILILYNIFIYYKLIKIKIK